MKFKTISDKEFESFVATQPVVSFLQSPYLAQRRSRDGWTYEYLGAVDAGKICGAALVFCKPVGMGYCRLEVLQGPVLDYDTPTTARFFLKSLKQYAVEKRAVSMMVVPNIILSYRGEDGQILDNGYSGARYSELFTECGYEHEPLTKTDSREDVLRWYFVKDLSDFKNNDELKQSFSSSAKRSIKRAERSGVTVRSIETNEMALYYDMLKHTSERREYTARDKEYYKSLIEALGPEHSKVLIAEISPKDLTSEIETLIRKQRDSAEREVDAQKQQKIQDKIDEYQKLLGAIDHTKATIPIAGSIVITYGNEVAHFSSASYDAYASIRATSLLRLHAMQHALRVGVTRFNFYGTKGNHSGHPEDEGIFQFKRSFGGIIEEQIGVFYTTPHPVVAIAIRIAGKIKRAMS